jgi:hypothetical protein
LTAFLCSIFTLSCFSWKFGDSFLLCCIIFPSTFYRHWRHLKKSPHKIVFPPGLWIWFLYSSDPGNFPFHFHSSLCCIIISFSPCSDWLKREFVVTLKNLTDTGQQFGGILAAHSITTTLKYWYHGSPPGEIVSLGVLSEGKSELFISCNIKKKTSVWILA